MIRTRAQAFPRLAAAAAVSAVAFCGCGKDGGPAPEPEPDYDAIDPIVYSDHVQPIFDRSCNTTYCHNAADAIAGLDLSSYDALAAGSDFGAMVVPAKPRLSHLYLHLTGDIEPRMPLGLNPLSDSAQRLFQRWIEAGAPFDDGRPMDADVTRKAFVACQGENSIAVIDMDTGLLARVFDVDQPHSVYVDRTAKRLYVARLQTASDNVHVYDAETYALLGSGRAGTFPALLGLTADRSQLWITNFTGFGDDDNAVRICDPQTLLEIVPNGLTAPNTEQPHGLAIGQRDHAFGARFVYVTNILTDNVSVFVQNGPNGPEFDTVVPLPTLLGIVQQPQQCVLSPLEDYLFVSALEADRVYVMRTFDNVFVATIQVGNGPWHIALSPDGGELWVSNWLGNSVSVIDVASPESPVMIEQNLAPPNPRTPGQSAIVRPIGIAFTPDGSQVWVAGANDDGSGAGHHPPPAGERPPGTVAAFDASTRTLLYVTEVPNFSRSVSFLP
jgi:DNA-binding beta-propeller fold protein YncE